jgi:hypothetical protein
MGSEEDKNKKKYITWNDFYGYFNDYSTKLDK